MSDPDAAAVTLELREGYQFVADFHLDRVPALLMDEPEPLGTASGPNASRVLAAAVADCLSASALFCLHRARVEVHGMRTEATVSHVRDERGRLRVGRITVLIHPKVDPADVGRLGRCLELFEDYCVVTQSVRAGFDVQVAVEPVTGTP